MKQLIFFLLIGFTVRGQVIGPSLPKAIKSTEKYQLRHY